MRITALETRRYSFPLEPPFPVAWDPEPRTKQDATLVIVHTDEGLEPALPRQARFGGRTAIEAIDSPVEALFTQQWGGKMRDIGAAPVKGG
jgi:hypothetical protein